MLQNGSSVSRMLLLLKSFQVVLQHRGLCDECVGYECDVRCGISQTIVWTVSGNAASELHEVYDECAQQRWHSE